MKILITGGAGFIGSHLTDQLVKEGYFVRILDSLDSQVHGNRQKPPSYLNKEAEFIKGDVRDEAILSKAVKGIDIIFHLAAAVGVGQSMYRIRHYVDVNVMGTASLLELLINKKNRVKKLIMASSMSVYGEGAYNCSKCGKVYPHLRLDTQLKSKDWNMKCPFCKRKSQAFPTNEDKVLMPMSVYAISKRDQEEICLNIGKAYRIPTVAFRYFNVYGARQALSNPYTGVAAIFSSRLLNRHNPLVYEDGLQLRDFINVKDIVRANILAMKNQKADYQVFNVGTGKGISILKLANLLIEKINPKCKPIIVNKYRIGDIRACFSDSRKINQLLGFKPCVKIEDGIEELIDWVSRQKAVDYFEQASEELNSQGLMI